MDVRREKYTSIHFLSERKTINEDSVYNLIIFSNFPQIKSALDEQVKCFVLKVSVEDILL